MEAIGRRSSPAAALEAARDRRDRTYDPELADLFVEHGDRWFEILAKRDPWDAVLDLEPQPYRTIEADDLDDALTVAADFIDLKSPYMAGHSRRCAALTADAAALLGCTPQETARLRRAALVHEFGTTGVPNSIWDKPGPLTRAEFDRVELHTMLTEQLLRRSPALAALNPVAAAHHEKADGSGYHKGSRIDVMDRGAGLLGAVDIYVGLTTERADRPAFSEGQAGTELRRLASDGALDARAVDAVLAAAGHGGPTQPRRDTHPGDRRTALHLAEDGRPPHPARLREDRGLDTRGRGALGDAERRRPLTASVHPRSAAARS
jgi:HD-GYP domain-containing protein (c-di-GMP phosphodiesterase class II)